MCWLQATADKCKSRQQERVQSICQHNTYVIERRYLPTDTDTVRDINLNLFALIYNIFVYISKDWHDLAKITGEQGTAEQSLA